ncbi:MAG: 50S ribosomal protein L4 [Thermoplasmata archaeon]|nr:50S ribosomal protein L4 [Euryarchaeota archaeon]RLF66827.1 MAG: 50S ribosomal protein L4 [Thermoplasmata archaeon]
MKVPVYDLEGNPVKEIELPRTFSEYVRADVIRKAFRIYLMNNRQPYGTNPRAGKNISAESWGVGYGLARIPRLPNGRGAFAPNTVGGYRAHGPKAEKIWKRHLNKKELRLALRSAISATAIKELVIGRGHKVPEDKQLPIVIVDDIQSIKKTKDLLRVLHNLGLEKDLERAAKRKIRAGKGKMRGRRYKQAKSVLIVVSKYDGIEKSASNIPGVEVSLVKQLNINKLAPGGVPGRLTIYTESALRELGGWP